MSDSLNKIPVSPITSFGNPSVPNGSTFGTNFSILQTGGYMEVYTLSGLTYTILSTPGINEYSGNSIPIQFTKGSGSAFSPDVLTLNSDNISSGRRKLGMLVYVYETDKIYQFNIKNYDTLWSNATGATGPGGPTVVMSDYGTTVKNNSAAGIALINAWTTSTISGVNGYNDTNASWAILQTQSITGGTYFQGNTTFTNSTGGTFNIFGPSNYDPGVISGETWTDNSNGSINLPQITVALFNNPNFFEPLKFYSIPSGTTGVGSIPALLNNDTNYVIVEYNNGSPRYNVLDNDGTVDWSSVILYMIIYRADNFVHILEFGNMGSGLSSKMNDRIISTDRFARESGCSLGLSGSTGVVTLSSGVVWNGPNRQIVNGVTSMGLFFKNYHSGGTWVYTTTAHTINNLYYDNGTDLVLATGGKYLVNWYFRGQELNDHLYEVVSSNQYDSVLGAEASNEPNLPELIISHAFLVGRIIIAVSATTGITQSAFTNVFQPSGASGIHNDLIGLQGGLPNEYYHLDSNKYNNLALTNTNNNFSVGQTFLSGLTATTITANNISGTTNYVSKFTGANSLGNSLIYDNGTNVGIGTTSPTGKLDVLGIATSSPSATVTAGDLVVDTANRTVYIGKQSNTSSDNTSFIFRDRLGARKSYWENASSGNISFGNFGTNYGVSIATSTLSFGVTSPARLVVDSGLSTFPSAVFTTGNVGIGITTPFTTLQVSGSTQVGLSSINAGSYTNGLAYVNPGGTATSLFLFQAGVASGHVGFRASDNNLYIVNSYTNGSVTNSAAITLTSTGNVGIGTTSPIAKLDVQGSITAATNLAKGVNISNNLISSANNDVLVGLDIAPNYVGGVGLTNTIVGGTGYSAGTYTNIALTGGTGTGAIATIIVIGSAVTTVTITTPGSGYYLGNILSTSGGTINGVGSGFNLTVNTLSNTSVKPIGLRVDGINIGRGGGYSSSNTVIGNLAGLNNTTGGSNTFLGYLSGQFNNSGSQNTFIGQNAGGLNTSGNNNTNIGVNAGFANTTGVANVFLGRDAGRFITDKSTPATSVDRSIMLGYRTSPLGDSQTNQIVIGYDSTGLGSNTTVLGSSSTVTAAIYGNLLLGTTVDTGQKLQVSGNTIINGGLTATTISATTINASNISGTTNYVSKFTGTNSLGNSVVYDNGTNVGIGTTSPTAKLHVSTVNGTESSIILGQESQNRWKFKIPASSTSLVLGDVGGDYVYFLSSGNIGIGTSTPSYKLDVSGTTRLNGQTRISGTTSAITNLAQGVIVNPTLVATANNDVLVGMDINPTFSGGTFTGVTSGVTRFNGTTQGFIFADFAGGNNSFALYPKVIPSSTNYLLRSDGNGLVLNSPSSSNPLFFALGNNSVGRFYGTTGNFAISNNGTFTDNGANFQVNGSNTASTNLARAASITNNLISAANNDALVGLDIAPNYVGGVGTTNTIVGGSSYTGTSYAGVPLTGGTGTGAIATVFINPSGVVSAVTITTAGSGYYLGNVLGTSGTTLGTVGSGFNLTINTLSTGTSVKPMGLRVDGIPIGRGGGYVSGNFAMGIDALRNNTIGINNIGIGLNTLLQNSNGSQNIAIGNYSLQNNQNSQNTSIGYASLISLSNGSANTSIGNNAGRYIANGSTPATNINNSIFIGLNAFPLADTQTNQIVIGTSSTGLGSNTTVLGNSSTVTTAIYGRTLLGTTTDNGSSILQVQGTTTSDGPTLGTELATTATGTNWVGTSFALGYDHTTGSTVALTSTLAAVIGTYYQIAYTITGRTAGSITINYGGASNPSITVTGTWGPLATSTAVLTITPTTDFDGTLVLSVKSQTGFSIATTTFTNSSGTTVNEIRNPSSNTNLFIGLNSGRRNTTGLSNSFIGFNSGLANTTGTNNSFFGNNSGAFNSTPSNNSFFGTAAGYSNTTGPNNTFIGTSTGYNNTSGGNNAFFGANAGLSNTGSENTFIGQNAGTNNTTATSNTFVGRSAGLQTQTGGANTFLGLQAGYNNTLGGSNVNIGMNSGSGNQTGSENIFMGYTAGRFISGGAVTATIVNKSILIGANTKPLADSQTNQIVIGYNSVGLGSNTTVLGNSSTLTTAIYGDLLLGTTTSISSSKLTITSTTQGVLLPRMTTSQINGIVSPVQGLTVFNTDLNTLCFYTTSWQKVTNTAM